MDFEKLAPWNWFKEEEEKGTSHVLAKKGENAFGLTTSFADIAI